MMIDTRRYERYYMENGGLWGAFVVCIPCGRDDGAVIALSDYDESMSMSDVIAAMDEHEREKHQ